ncbi:ABC transporter ATP-binding protein [Chelatococcus asaccharovorans]|uniref:Carbohydrate ABC transporter ATP-binding protein (CUT1 family) n=1 Tax=Chelatococcus asaccharovorans TaxID=28210 RepID=A0A2V3U956_9HYPH|nr:ABC transporter ATP-binding protein [Chelatococcus asaccharovorans]MBS7705595.1 ABC transporter ATP-binding protein [Chelatococcus asaccharovorans]PXW59993.1 carbohydrate ABC transporter ATP-binding protein (CUT1 family) [Chelatococcus asaccharovorans]
MSSIVFDEIEKSYGATAVLKKVSLSIADGEFMTLLGPSGCGKSTLLRILAGLELQNAGTVSIGELPVDGIRPKGRDVAMVFQSYALYPHMTVGSNMGLPLRMRRLNAWQRLPVVGRLLPGTHATTRDIAAEVAKTAEALGIGHLLDRKPGQLSGGQRQRVAVGRAMVRHPAVFLMDEPLSNLDAKLRVQMRGEIKELHQRLGVTFVYVTHDQAEAMTLSDRVAVMLDGELLQVAPPQRIYADPDDRRVAEFIGSPKINMLEGIVQEHGRVAVAGATLNSAIGCTAGTAVSVGIRPEALHLDPHAGIESFTGSVRLVEHLGSDLFVHLDLAGQDTRLIARLLAERAPHISIGQTLHLASDPERILFFDANGHRIRRDHETRAASVAQLRELA